MISISKNPNSMTVQLMTLDIGRAAGVACAPLG